MHTIWKGSLTFGLVNIPVRVCGAIEEKHVSFHQYHESCKSRIKYQKYCPHCQKEVPAHEIIKGYEVGDGLITVNEGELASIDIPSLKTVELAGFIKEKEVDTLFYQKPYYLLPDKSDRAYWLLYHGLKKTGKVGIARFAVHSREHLALVRPAKGLLSLCTLYYPEEIRTFDTVSPQRPDPKQLDMAINLIEQQTINFKPGDYTDRYREALEKMLEKKQPEALPVQNAAPQVMDLIEALRRSVQGLEKKKQLA